MCVYSYKYCENKNRHKNNVRAKINKPFYLHRFLKSIKNLEQQCNFDINLK